MHKYTLITGASRGLGFALARECAQRNHNLILVSLPNENIQEIASDLSIKYKIKTYAKEIDLSNSQQRSLFIEWVLKSHFKINLLINNAGIGGTNQFSETSIDFFNTLINLNMTALIHLTLKILPELKKNKKANILNIASIAALNPIPYKTVYAASKSFISTFSQGLNTELRDTSVSISVAYPGGMETSPEISKRMKTYKGLLKHSFLSVELIAKECIDKTLKGNKNIYPGSITKISALILNIIPTNIKLNIFRKRLKKELEYHV